MAGLQWSEAVLQQQRNWIGRSEGLRLRFRILELGEEVSVFTTRPETLWGVTFLALAPEHPLARRLAERARVREAYEAFLSSVRRLSDIERLALGTAKRVFDLRAHAVHPVTSRPVPVFAADCVLLEHGTGAVMGVPAHDQRDFELARQLGLPIRVVVQPRDGEALDPEILGTAYEGEGVMTDSDGMDGLPSEEARRLVTAQLVERGMGQPEVHYRLRDWLISRQRYWGTPIPVVYCEACGIVPVPEDQLPALLPEEVDYRPTGEAVSPLAAARSWVETVCPACGGHARRETDTMDTFVDSSWYFLRFCDPHNSHAPFDPGRVAAWMPVDEYIGGVEHAVLHLIYARFFTKVLFDLGLVPHPEPFRRLLNHGMVAMGGKAMSKSRGNVVDPREVIGRFGADALRLYVLFAAPPEQDYEWPPEGATAAAGMHRFLQRVWRLVTGHADVLRQDDPPSAGASPLMGAIHRRFAAITADYERHAFNTAIAKMMELFQEVRRAARARAWTEFRVGTTMLLHALAPVAPFVVEELWHRIGGQGSIHRRPWPQADAELARAARQTLVVQVNGKVRDRLEVDPDITEEAAVQLALASDRVRQFLNNRTPVRIVARPPRVVNLVVK
jgi:leucyl-tRNA synthetase